MHAYKAYIDLRIDLFDLDKEMQSRMARALLDLVWAPIHWAVYVLQSDLMKFRGARLLYSETTWAVGIAQLTHHEVQGGGKNPETEGRGIFAPTADRVVS